MLATYSSVFFYEENFQVSCGLMCLIWQALFWFRLHLDLDLDSAVTTFLYLFLCQASVADPPIPGRPDDGTAWENEKSEGRRTTRTESEGSVSRKCRYITATWHIVSLTDAFHAAQIRVLHSGHLALSAELLLSINVYYKHTCTANTQTDSRTYSVINTHKLPPADELCMGTTRDGRAQTIIRKNSRAISGSEREGRERERF